MCPNWRAFFMTVNLTIQACCHPPRKSSWYILPLSLYPSCRTTNPFTLSSFRLHSSLMRFFLLCTKDSLLPRFVLYVFCTHFVAGVRHNGVVCNGCSATPILGTRWQCGSCASVDLCSSCYHDDKHDPRHHFYRVPVPGGPR